MVKFFEDIAPEEEFKKIMHKENLSWEKLSAITEESDRSNLRKKVIGYINKLSYYANAIGYEIIFKKK